MSQIPDEVEDDGDTASVLIPATHGTGDDATDAVEQRENEVADYLRDVVR